MCPTSINRRNVLRQVRTGDITGTTLFECATCVVARLGLHPSCHHKVLEKLEELVRDCRIKLQDAVLSITSASRRKELLERQKEDEARKRRTRARTADHRHHGIRGLEVKPELPAEDPDWEALYDQELDEWASMFHTPTPPAGEWDEKDAELVVLIAYQKADAQADENREPVYGCCGSLDDLVAAGVDVGIEERRFALIR